MVATGLHLHAVKDGVEVVLRADAHVLLSELLNLDIDRNRLLQSPLLACVRCDGSRGCTYKLLSEGHLLELQLVRGGLGGAKQHSCCQQSTLHAGQFEMAVGK